jgi:hypothetical protein
MLLSNTLIVPLRNTLTTTILDESDADDDNNEEKEQEWGVVECLPCVPCELRL